jgi:6-pyruvoyltetrahydropterin/6-carboxytetrahydropterin synthase
MIEIFKEFAFDAAHQLGANVAPGHPYSRLHGHSFRVRVYLRGTPDPRTGWIMDFAALEAAIRPLRERLDHHYLNEIEGLERPTLETLAGWIWQRLKPSVPTLHRVVVRRGSGGEGCVYQEDAGG